MGLQYEPVGRANYNPFAAMNPILRDMFDHQFWADAELWNALAAHAPARDDTAIRHRLHHIHQVQRAFFWGVGGGVKPINLTKPDDFASFDDLRAYARESHDEIRAGLERLTDARLAEPIRIPWFKDPPLTITITEALTQCAMHSHHHRGQNATRLRELGGVPPSTDLIVWYWKGRPQANWA
jgi:uncharacterized damage-inducible protein DinB